MCGVRDPKGPLTRTVIVHLSIAVLLIASAPAFAQHDHGADEHHHGPAHVSLVAARAAIVAASFDTMLYLGSYEGVLPNVRWSRDRFAAVATGGLYRVHENGADFYGLGDIGVHGQAVVVRGQPFDAGVVGGVSVPTGDSRHGMGMGHVMVMPGCLPRGRRVVYASPRRAVTAARSGQKATTITVRGHWCPRC